MLITRWRRYGFDRLYLKSDEGDSLGWYDLATGDAHPTKIPISLMIVEVDQWRVQHHLPPQGQSDIAGSPTDMEGESQDDKDNQSLSSSTEASVAVIAPGPDFARSDSDVDVIRGSDEKDILTSGAQEDVAMWAPPTGNPVRDLAFNPAGLSLQPQVDAAHVAGERPTFLRRLLRGQGAYSSWEKGQIGERLVADELQKLVARDPRWGFINSIPVGEHGADIDHLVVGPSGVFTLNAKYHPDAKIWVASNTFRVNGTYHPYIRNARYEAKRAGKLLTQVCGFVVEVHGVVVPVDARDVTIRERPKDVTVVNRRRLVRYLSGFSGILSPDIVSAVLHAARLSNTWETHA